jgi:hypothetical protein
MLCEKGIDNLEDMIDVFWEHPVAFAMFVYARYVEEISGCLRGPDLRVRTSALAIDDVSPQPS